jgi:hypothetical protein
MSRPEGTAVGQCDQRRGAARNGREVGATVTVEARKRVEQAPCVRVAGFGEDRLHVALLHDAPGVHHRDPVSHSGNDAKVVGDHQDASADLLLEFLEKLQNLRLDGHVQGSCRLVGDEQRGVARQCHCDHDALPLPARELVGVIVQTSGTIADANERQQLGGAGAGGGLPKLCVQPQWLSDLAADREDRVQRGHRVLEDHRDLVAANVAHLLDGHREEITPVQSHGAGNPGGGDGQQAH